MSAQGFICSRCGESHGDLPVSYGVAAPAYWYKIPPGERGRRARLSSDRCVIDDKYFFVVGNVEIPIIGEGVNFVWSVWVSLGGHNFRRARELWETKGRESEPPYFCWVGTELPCYPSTLNLKARMHTRPVGERPLVELEPTDHPLAVEQRRGITLARVREIAECVLHG